MDYFQSDGNAPVYLARARLIGANVEIRVGTPEMVGGSRCVPERGTSTHARCGAFPQVHSRTGEKGTRRAVSQVDRAGGRGAAGPATGRQGRSGTDARGADGAIAMESRGYVIVSLCTRGVGHRKALIPWPLSEYPWGCLPVRGVKSLYTHTLIR